MKGQKSLREIRSANPVGTRDPFVPRNAHGALDFPTQPPSKRLSESPSAVKCEVENSRRSPASLATHCWGRCIVAGRHDDYLLIRLQEVSNSAPLDPKRSWGPALCEL